MDAPLGLSVQAHDLDAEQVPHHVQVVRGEIDDRADVADARRERALAPGMDLEDAAHLAGIEALFELADRRVETLDVADGEHRALSPRCGHELLCLVQVGRDRLFHEHMQAVLDGCEADLEVMPGRHRDDDRVEAALVEQLAIGPIADQPPLPGPGHGFVGRVAHGHELGLADAIEYAGAPAPHHAAADDPHADHPSVTSRTARTMRSRSGPVSAGWTGRLSTSRAMRSATGNDWRS